jgi:hypothetical protein
MLRHRGSSDPAVGGAQGEPVDPLVLLVSRMPVDMREGRLEASHTGAVTVAEVHVLALGDVLVCHRDDVRRMGEELDFPAVAD